VLILGRRLRTHYYSREAVRYTLLVRMVNAASFSYSADAVLYRQITERAALP